jgi:site-specific DNA-methyltransferase (adenine-specific)/modification methylase
MRGGIVREEVIGRARLLLGDCRDILPSLERVDLVCTDPPYGIGEARNKNASRSALAQSHDYGVSDWDDKPPEPELIAEIREKGKWQIVFGGNYFELPPTRCWLVWDKLNGANDFADCELAWTNLQKAVRRIAYRWHGMIREKGAQRGDHPTQKPLEVMRWCIGHAPDAETILDPFMGSGTTGVAAVQMGRAFIGIEREERYFEAAVRRIREANGDDAGPLFGEAA